LLVSQILLETLNQLPLAYPAKPKAWEKLTIKD
jgi:hypothetical protein